MRRPNHSLTIIVATLLLGLPELDAAPSPTDPSLPFAPPLPAGTGPNLPQTSYARMKGSLVAVDDKVLIIGGDAGSADAGGDRKDGEDRRKAAEAITTGVTTMDYASLHMAEVATPIPDPNRMNATGQTCEFDRRGGRVICFGGLTVADGSSTSAFIPGLGLFDPSQMQWQPQRLTTIPLRHAHASTYLNEHIYVFGGVGATGFQSDFWSIDLSASASEPFAATQLSFTGLFARRPAARESSCLASISDNLLLLLGGRDMSGQPLPDSWVYDVKKDIWTEATGWFRAAAPGARSGMSCVGVGGKVYVFGGENAEGNLLGDLWVLDSRTWKWARVWAVSPVKPSDATTTGPAIGMPVERLAAAVNTSVTNSSTILSATASATASPSPRASTPSQTVEPSGIPSPSIDATTPSQTLASSAPPSPSPQASVPSQTVASSATPSPSPYAIISSQTIAPSARSYHSATVIGSYMVITGGATAFGSARANFTNLQSLLLTDPTIYIYDTVQATWVPDASSISLGFATTQSLSLSSIFRKHRTAFLAVSASLAGLLCFAIIGVCWCLWKRGQDSDSKSEKKRADQSRDHKKPTTLHNVIRLSDIWPMHVSPNGKEARSVAESVVNHPGGLLRLSTCSEDELLMLYKYRSMSTEEGAMSSDGSTIHTFQRNQNYGVDAQHGLVRYSYPYPVMRTSEDANTDAQYHHDPNRLSMASVYTACPEPDSADGSHDQSQSPSANPADPAHTPTPPPTAPPRSISHHTASLRTPPQEPPPRTTIPPPVEKDTLPFVHPPVPMPAAAAQISPTSRFGVPKGPDTQGVQSAALLEDKRLTLGALFGTLERKG